MQQPEVIPLGGGLDQVTPPLSAAPGTALFASNYESDAHGYRRLIGYERFDGRPKPSLAAYWILPFTSGSTVTVGATVTGATSAATGTVVAVVVASGSAGAGTAVGHLVLSDVTGTFVSGENLTSGGVIGISSAGATLSGEADDALHQSYLSTIRASRRAAIAAPAGSGPVRGVWGYAGAFWCVRDNAGATAAVLFKATSAGWVAQSLGHTIPFTQAGTAAFQEGQVLTGGTSAATATIRRVVTRSGSYSAGTAAGTLTISNITGTFQANETITTSSTSGKAGSAQVANALPPGGRYEFINMNFFGSTKTVRMYGVNGVGRAFEWDGTYFTPIETGLPVNLDRPNHIGEYKKHLFLGFAAGSVMFSGLGEPLTFTSLAGGGEIGMGVEVTGLLGSASVLVIFGATAIAYLTGNTVSDFVLSPVSDEAGAQRWSVQLATFPMYSRDFALYNLQTTSDTLGGWRLASLSQKVEPLLEEFRRRGLAVRSSMRVRNRDLYRLFLTSGQVLSVYLGRKYPEVMRLELPITARCTYSGDDVGGAETLLIGGEDGMVYEMDAGNDWDGAQMTCILRLQWGTLRSPRLRKRFHKAFGELRSEGTVTLSGTADYDYGSAEQPVAFQGDFSVLAGGGGYWREADWGAFNWSSQDYGTVELDLQGIGRNISLVFFHQSTNEAPHTISGVAFNWSPRGMVK